MSDTSEGQANLEGVDEIGEVAEGRQEDDHVSLSPIPPPTSSSEAPVTHPPQDQPPEGGHYHHPQDHHYPQDCEEEDPYALPQDHFPLSPDPNYPQFQSHHNHPVPPPQPQPQQPPPEPEPEPQLQPPPEPQSSHPPLQPPPQQQQPDSESKGDDDDVPSSTEGPPPPAAAEAAEEASSSSEADIPKQTNTLYANPDLNFSEMLDDDRLVQGAYLAGFKFPSHIQVQSLPGILAGKNVIGQAHHGTGKTAAFTLGILSLINESTVFPQALILCPVRELANQVADVFETLGVQTNFRVFRAVRQETRRPSRGLIPAHVIVGTPGTVEGLIRTRKFDPKKIQIFCIDEADHMLAPGPNNSLRDQTERIRWKMSSTCQILLFSATFPPSVRQFAVKCAPNAVRITVKKENLKQDTIKQLIIVCKTTDQKFQTLRDLYSLVDSIGQSMIFCQTRNTAKLITKRLRDLGYGVMLLHGKDMKVSSRDEVMQSFRDHKANVLVSTNLLSRGIDVSSVNLVLNYDVPVQRNGAPDPQTYIHRIGRSGRFGRKGIALNFVDDDDSIGILQAILEYWKMEDDVETIPAEDVLAIEEYVRAYVQ